MPCARPVLDGSPPERVYRPQLTVVCACTGIKLKVRNFVILAASAFFQRYFTLKSMRKNDVFIIAIAAIFLATKTEDAQIALNDVIEKFWAERYVCVCVGGRSKAPVQPACPCGSTHTDS